MSYRKLISALVFAAFGLCFSEAVRAQEGCDNPDYCGGGDGSGAIENITGSSVDCIPQPGGEIRLSPGDGTATNPPTYHHVGTAKCTQNPGGSALGICGIELTMTNVTLSACVSNTLTATAFCQDDVGVEGLITCASGTMNLGIAGIPRNKQKCEEVFLAGNPLAAGQILSFTVTTQPDPGGAACTGRFVSMSDAEARACNSGPLSFANPAVDCTPPGGVTRRSTLEVGTAVLFEFDFRQTVNTSPTFCRGGQAVDKGQITVEIYGSNTFFVSDIDQTPPVEQPLQCEGAPLVCGAPTNLNGDEFPDLLCTTSSCPSLGVNLGKLPRNSNGTVTASCTGQLNSGQAILGLGDVAISPK